MPKTVVLRGSPHRSISWHDRASHRLGILSITQEFPARDLHLPPYHIGRTTVTCVLDGQVVRAACDPVAVELQETHENRHRRRNVERNPRPVQRLELRGRLP